MPVQIEVRGNSDGGS